MELWQIGDSPYAPKFQIISKPNDWVKTIKSNLTDTKLMQLEFWTQFKEYASTNHSNLRLRKAYPQHWYDIRIGSSKSHLSLIVDTKNSQIRCELYIPDSKELFNALHAEKDIIAPELDNELEWMELEGKKASRIKAVYDIDVSDADNWDKCFSWLMDTAQSFQVVFGKHVKKLNV